MLAMLIGWCLKQDAGAGIKRQPIEGFGVENAQLGLNRGLPPKGDFFHPAIGFDRRCDAASHSTPSISKAWQLVENSQPDGGWSWRRTKCCDQRAFAVPVV